MITNYRLKKTLIVVGSILVAVILVVSVILIVALSSTPDYPIYTSSASDYNSGDYYFYDGFFMPTLPENATVVAYYSYDYWKEEQDQYLELSFNSKEEMDSYLTSFYEYLAELRSDIKHFPTDGEWFIRETNPYDSSFVDCFYKEYHYFQYDITYTGYEVTEDDYHCCYAVLSYSYDSFAVIQSVSNGHFERNDNDYIPQYLERFGIDETITNKKMPLSFY